MHDGDHPDEVRFQKVNHCVGEMPTKVAAQWWVKFAVALRVIGYRCNQLFHFAIKPDAQLRIDPTIVRHRLGQFLVRRPDE